MGSRKLSNYSKILNLKNILLTFAISFCFTGLNAFASDNVLQAIQIDGTKDSYNIILKSDDVADLKKTIQAPNKMVLNLKGIRASKTINTIYNNTSNVDSVVVEPMGEDAVKIMIQADNANNAAVHFDTLRTPLGVLDNSEKQTKATDEIVLNGPMESYKPVYDDSQAEEDNISLSGTASSAARHLKKIFKSDKITLLTILGVFAILVLSGIKAIKGNDNEIRVGLTQSLKDREIDLYRSLGVNNEVAPLPAQTNQGVTAPQNMANYGLRAYQQGNRSPYITSEVQRPRPAAPAPSINLQQVAQNMSLKQSQTMTQGATQNSIQGVGQRTASVGTKPKTTNIDSMKFLESMTKIYEKNGRSDLAQGLKTNMKKAKMNLS